MVLLREVIGSQLRNTRKEQGATLRDISSKANVALGYLSEIERGRKEPSSELLSSICSALEISVSILMRAVTIETVRIENQVRPIQSSRTKNNIKAA
jgi:transcriptional regulator with XRE-family HTH domain